MTISFPCSHFKDRRSKTERVAYLSNKLLEYELVSSTSHVFLRNVGIQLGIATGLLQRNLLKELLLASSSLRE
jgi:hypothetical protein